MEEFELYKEAFKRKLINSIKDIELPPEWKPQDVIKFIINKIEKG